MAPKRTTLFNESHVIAFGLTVYERDASTKAVVSVSCRFCLYFGRDVKIGAKHKATANIQYFRRPFRADTNSRHMDSQHSVHWKTYSDIIIGEMLFHPDDLNDEVTKERALAIFENVIGQEEDERDSDPQTDSYRITIKNPAQFELVVNYVSAGASFRTASRIVQMTR